MSLRRRLAALGAALLAAATLALPAAAARECVGQNLFERMPPERLAELDAAAEGVPYRQGLFWRAEKDGQRVTLLGTYHFADPRHDLTMDRFGPEIDEAALLMVEAGPEEEERLTRAMTADPTLLVDPDGPTLPERFTDAEWKSLSAALEARGLPAVIASRLRPWYVAVMLGVSPCMMRVIEERGDPGGLDHLLVERAEAAAVPVRALEPWDTVFTLFEGMTPREEEDMIRAAMPAAEYADDYAVTLADAYFSGDSWMIWEFGRFDAYDNSGLTRDEVDEQMRLAQEKLMDRRNESWIEPIERAAAEAAAQGKGVVIGFGALHLPGDHGVLRLLENRGWTISPVTVEGIGDGG
ncbi:TraB/GumN family protein [Paracoccus denitrificans]|uniref:GumN family protein n=1 Tax=Paracoccus denitrificans (strain Pd 1222) TaxID=318586 RepID=A1B879_PARDP|nr:TraB/GumN family protein [Paracoccus denitrificans]ABL71723.1 GumN family protein [Paracoccus denitrificans PD1222]MBB4628183.1 hypothetical protein [Paracoccus denitrificans]MCU7429248.1 TraB/GumN family protein [Paracoccus denitrificans]UPV98055.1 TraB/GumN family protein [Paracoccus denitrificans]WQO35972.1 TraB/GumN family protein [Paracoccus denitrificans]